MNYSNFTSFVLIKKKFGIPLWQCLALYLTAKGLIPVKISLLPRIYYSVTHFAMFIV